MSITALKPEDVAVGQVWERTQTPVGKRLTITGLTGDPVSRAYVSAEQGPTEIALGTLLAYWRPVA